MYKPNDMRTIFLLAVILLFSCDNPKNNMLNRQEAIKKEMTQIKDAYYRKADSLAIVKKTDTGSARQHEIAEEMVTADNKKNALLIPLQKEYDSLDAALQKYQAH